MSSEHVDVMPMIMMIVAILALIFIPYPRILKRRRWFSKQPFYVICMRMSKEVVIGFVKLYGLSKGFWFWTCCVYSLLHLFV